MLQLRCAPKRPSFGSAQAHVFPQPMFEASDEESVNEGDDDDEWVVEGVDDQQEHEGEDPEDDASSSVDSSSKDSSSEDSACDFSGVPDNLDNAHNRQWYPRKTLRSIYFPFRALELGLMLAWDSTGKKISRRKMDSLLSMVSDDKFDTRNLIGITAKKLRKLRKTLPLLTTESIECNKTVTKKVYLLMSFRHDKHSLCLQVVDADGLISTKVLEYKTVRVTYVSLTDFIRRVFSDPVQRSSLRFGVEDTGDEPVTYVASFPK